MKTRTKTLLIVLALLVLLLGGGFAALGWPLLRPTPNAEAVRIYVADGQVDAPFALGPRWLTRRYPPREGSYIVPPYTRTLHLVRTLHRGQQSPLRLTLGKHRTPASLNAYLSAHLKDTFQFTLDDLHLFMPNTYELYWTTSPTALRERMLREYDHFWQGRDTAACGLSRREVVVLASIVEEETNHTPEKADIASVYLNRLRRGMPLQADPTVKYAVGDFALRRILLAHLQTPSPFNTYLHTGLPPAPICTPSASSIDAVLRAKPTPYLYFCASPAMDGTHRFATTLAEHNRNAAAFHTALNQRKIMK